MRIVVVGSGYVGLVSGACLSEFGHKVVCVDKDENKINSLKNGVIPIYEPNLGTVVRTNEEEGRLTFTTDLASSVPNAEVVFIAVGTPARRGDGYADLTYVFAAAEEIAKCLSGYTVVVIKSTVPVGTNRRVIEIIKTVNPTADFDVASNPEFLREGSAVEDFRRPDRVVVGAESKKAKATMKEVYRPLYLNETPILFTSLESAELVKYASNAFLATKISFINEMADLCEKTNGDVQDVARGMGFDGRINSKYLHAGPGFGGSCFPKDTLALLKTGEDHGVPMRIVGAVVAVNDARKKEMGVKIENAFGGLAHKSVAILGLTFKPNTDDMRDAPSLDIVPYLQSKGAVIRAYDPEGASEAKSRLGLDLCKDAYDAMDGADGVVIVTEWNQFRALDLDRVKKLLKMPIVVDLRNIYKPKQMRKAGFKYTSVGRV